MLWRRVILSCKGGRRGIGCEAFGPCKAKAGGPAERGGQSHVWLEVRATVVHGCNHGVACLSPSVCVHRCLQFRGSFFPRACLPVR